MSVGNEDRLEDRVELVLITLQTLKVAVSMFAVRLDFNHRNKSIDGAVTKLAKDALALRTLHAA